MSNELIEAERRETIDELSELLFVTQEIGQRLSNETHGDSYSSIEEFNDLLHQARIQLEKIRGVAVVKD